MTALAGSPARDRSSHSISFSKRGVPWPTEPPIPTPNRSFGSFRSITTVRSKPRSRRPTRCLIPPGRRARAPRLATLARLADVIAANRDLLAATMAEEMGKPLFQGQMEADLCSGIARYYAERTEEIPKPQPVASDVGEGWVACCRFFGHRVRLIPPCFQIP